MCSLWIPRWENDSLTIKGVQCCSTSASLCLLSHVSCIHGGNTCEWSGITGNADEIVLLIQGSKRTEFKERSCKQLNFFEFDRCFTPQPKELKSLLVNVEGKLVIYSSLYLSLP